jgi:oligopeptide/dipeptide ABC transporter ATP-binding protein
MSDVLLDVDRLCVSYQGFGGPVQALRDVNMQACAGEVVGIVGESGCGKTTLASAVMSLLPMGAEITAGEVRFRGKDILKLGEREKRQLRGRHIAMIFQDPMTAFHPALTIGRQLLDYQVQIKASRREKLYRAERMLSRCGVADSNLVMQRHVHELSGGMRQRAAISAALLMTPDILIADEPTTALDVTMEAQIIHLLRELRHEHQGAIIVITHNLGVIGELCDRVYVMYAGEVVEEAPVDAMYHAAAHPYTKALLACDPAGVAQDGGDLPTIPGRPPDLAVAHQGCIFAARCSQVQHRCHVERPQLRELLPDHQVACHMATA